jgi:hypothetical protein
MARDEMRQRGLARAWRAPKDDRGELIRLDRPPQRPIRRSDLLLTDKVRKLSRPQTLGQRSLNGFPSLWSAKQIGNLIA